MGSKQQQFFYLNYTISDLKKQAELDLSIVISYKQIEQIANLFIPDRYYLSMGLSNSRQEKALQEAKRMREDLYARVEQCRVRHGQAFAAINPELKNKILVSSAIELSDMMDNKQATTLQVVLTFIERTINVGVKNNYVFDELFEQAIFGAMACDQQRSRDKHEKKSWRPGMDPQNCYPPFYGVPASIKETIVMKGRQIHVGFVAKVNPVSQHDGLFMMMVRKMGFLPIARSNVPQALKTLDTNNNIFGYCKNPWNHGRSCGGSSGGQSGMVASYSSPIGFGSDIGGSLRIPAAFTGLVTMKPHGRYSRIGNAYFGKFTGGLPVKGQLGPLTRTVQDLILVHNYLYNPENYKDIPLQMQDPFIKHIPLKMSIIQQQKKLKIGVIRKLKHASCSKANQRALNETIQILKSKGHEIVEVHLEKLEKLYFFLLNLFIFDQNLHLFSQFKGDEPLTVEFKLISLTSKIPWLLRRIIMWLIGKREPRLAQMIKASRPLSGVQVFQKIYDIEKILCPQVYKEFATKKLDAVVLPTFVTPAPKLGQIGKLQYFFSFSTSWNVLFYPVGTIPVTIVRQDQLNFNDTYNDSYTNNVRKTLEGATGLPVGVQIAATPYNEEKVLYLMRSLEKQIKFRQKYRIPE